MSGRARSSASWTDSSRPREGGQPGIRAPAGGTARGPATGMGRERAKPLCSRPHGDRTTVNDPLRLDRADRVLVLAPHPDDETLATGGPLPRALAVFVRLALARLAAGGRPRERQFVVHHDGPLPASARDAVLTLTPEERERKRLAILCHASQLRLRRRALLGFADAQELFLAPAAPGEHDARHPVRHARVDGGVALLLELERRGRPGAFGAPDLGLPPERPGHR